MPIDRQNTPPPAIGKIGRYTVFITPPAPTTPNSQSEPNPPSSPKPHFAQSSAERDVKERNVKVAPLSAPPIMSPPIRSEKKMGAYDQNGGSVAGMFWNAVNRVQLANSTIDDHVSRWFGLDQSKYQWALDEYHQNKGTTLNAAIWWLVEEDGDIITGCGVDGVAGNCRGGALNELDLALAVSGDGCE